MRNEENPRAGGSETGDACRQKKWREFFKKVISVKSSGGKKGGGFFKKPPATPPQKYL